MTKPNCCFDRPFIVILAIAFLVGILIPMLSGCTTDPLGNPTSLGQPDCWMIARELGAEVKGGALPPVEGEGLAGGGRFVGSIAGCENVKFHYDDEKGLVVDYPFGP